MSFLRESPNIGLADTYHGDTLKTIALRELGDASLWVVLAELNDLRSPYLSETPGPHVLAYGAKIKTPAPTSRIQPEEDAEKIYGTDIELQNGQMTVDNGDIALVSGAPNLRQALKHRIKVHKRELGFHPEYGCYVHSLIGAANGPVPAGLSSFFVRSSLLEDGRVGQVPECVADVLGDQIRVDASVQPIIGAQDDLKVIV